MYTALLIYLIIASSMFTCLLNRKIQLANMNFVIKKAYLFTIIAIIPLVYAFASRSLMVGTDTYSIYYQIYYMGYVINHWSSTLYEGLFIWIFKVLGQLGQSFSFILLTLSLFICFVFINYFFKNNKKYNTIISVLMFFIWIYAPSINILRQILAVTVSFLAIIFLEQRRYIVGIILLIASMFIHMTAVIMIVYLLYFLCKENNELTKKLPIFSLIISLFLLMAFNLVIKIPFLSKFAASVNDFSFSTVNYKFFLFPLLVLPLIIINWKKIMNLDSFNYLHLCGYLLIFPAILSSGYFVFSFRLMYFFIPSEIIIVSQIGKCYTGGRKILVDLYLIVVTICTFYLIYYVLKVDGITPFSFS